MALGALAGRAFLQLGIDDAEFTAGLDKARTKLTSLASSVARVGKILGLAGVAIATPLAASAKAASTAEESFDKLSDVFGVLTGRAKAFGDALAESIGRSKVDVQDTLSRFQTFFGGLGLGAEAAAEMSLQLTKLAFDLASFANISDDEAISALTQAVSKGGNALLQYGIVLKGTSLDLELLNSDLASSADAASLQAKALARVAIINRELAARGVVGDAADAMTRLAGRTQQLNSAVKDAAATTGSALLPVLSQVASQMTGIVKQYDQFIAANQGVVTAAALLSSSLLAGTFALGSFGEMLKGISDGISVAATAMKLLGGATKAIPLVALGAVFVALAYKLGLVEAAAEALGISFDELAESEALKKLQEQADSFSADKIVDELKGAKEQLELERLRLENAQILADERAAQPKSSLENIPGVGILVAAQDAIEIQNLEGALEDQRQQVKLAKEYVRLLQEQKNELEAQAEAQSEAAKSALASKKAASDKAQAIKDLRERLTLAGERYDFEQEQIDAIARAGAVAALEGHDLKMRLLEIEHNREIENAQLAGQSLSLVFAKIGLERKAAIAVELKDLEEQRKAVEERIKDAAEDVNRSGAISVSGTFAGSLAQQSLGLSATLGTDEKQLVELQKQTVLLDKIEQKKEAVRLGLQVGGD